MVRTNTHLKIARYHQHLHEMLDLDLSPLEYMMKCFPEVKEKEEMRRIVGRYGLTGKQQVCPIRQLSDGQRCRVVFAWLAWQVPHLLLLDEPTNHLDMETIDALADAVTIIRGVTIDLKSFADYRSFVFRFVILRVVWFLSLTVHNVSI